MKVSGSILTDKIKHKDAIKIFERGNIDYIHIDVMDGKFVQNKSFPISEILELSKCTKVPFDVHLMVSNPDKYIDSLSLINTEYITFHYEVNKNIDEIIEHIKNNGIKAGISIKPSTNIKDIFKYLPKIDLVLVMSVEPGKSGQTFMNSVLYKIDVLKKEIEEKKYKTIISVDGGVNDTNIDILKEKKVDMIVSSSSLLNGNTLEKVNNIKK